MGHFSGRMHASRSGRYTGMSEAGRGAAVKRVPTHEEIAKLAYSYWESRGRSGGSAVEDWLRAEGELRQRA